MNKVIKLFLLTSLIGGFSLSIERNEGAPVSVDAITSFSYDDDASLEPNYKTQNDLTFKYMNLGSAINNYRGDKIKVGVIDSGIKYDHEDFNGTSINANSRYYEWSSTSNQWVYYSYDKYQSKLDDTFHHGSEVASTIASAINSLGGVGIAPNVELYVFKVTNSNNGYEIGAIQSALIDAANMKLDVVNMSIQCYENAVSYGTSYQGGSTGCSNIFSYYLNLAYNAGVTLVAASGNYNTSEPSYPASNNHVISVGSLEKYSTNTKASYSNYGQYIDLVAPGYVNVATNTTNKAYKTISGTSFSAPLVTGAIALYKQKNPDATPAQIEQALYDSCDKIDDSSSQYSNWAGNGSLNVEKFLGIDESTFASITPDATSLNLYKNSTYQISIKATHNDGNITKQIIDDRYSFIVSNPNVLSVNETGKIIVKTSGEATITIKGPNNTSATIEVDVSPIDIPVTDIAITNKIENVYIEDEDRPLSLKYTISPENATNTKVYFSSSDSSVISIDENGNFTYKHYGETTITVTTDDEGYTDSFTVTVFDIVTDYNGELLSIDDDSFTLNTRFEPNNDDSLFVYESTSELNTVDDETGIVSLVESGVTIIEITGIIDAINDGYTDCIKYIYLYIDDGDTVKKATTWANEFLTNISCDSTGRTPPSLNGWNNSKTSFSNLDEVCQHYIATYNADENSDDVIAKAMSKYDYVISKYNKTSIVYAEFITERAKSSSIVPTVNSPINTANILIIVSLSIVIIASIGGYILIRNKHEKENN